MAVLLTTPRGKKLCTCCLYLIRYNSTVLLCYEKTHSQSPTAARLRNVGGARLGRRSALADHPAGAAAGAWAGLPGGHGPVRAPADGGHAAALPGAGLAGVRAGPGGLCRRRGAGERAY